jgi:hypothetical protein
MRAIIKCDSTIDIDVLEAFLSTKNLWPALPQDHPEVQRRRQELLDTIAPEDRALAESTLLYTIYHDGTKTWGIINRPSKHSYTFRLKNPVAIKLQSACQKLVADMQTAGGTYGTDGHSLFTFTAPIDVLEPGKDDHAYFGEVMPQQRLQMVVQKRRTEAMVGICAAAVGVIMLLLTIPPVGNQLLALLGPNWMPWVRGLLERLSSSAFVTAIVSWLNIFFFWLDIRRRPAIRWSLE